MKQLKIKRRDAQIQLARSYLWDYCRLTDPHQYVESKRPYLVELCNTLQSFLNGELLKPDGRPYLKLMMNLPPRHLKTYTLINCVTWWLGNNPDRQIISISYNDMLSMRFSKAIRDKIDTENVGHERLYFQDVFDEIRLSYGDKSTKIWALEGSFHSYLGGSLKSTITGMGCQLGIIDDPIKNDTEALNDAFLDDQYFHYKNTFLQRIEKHGMQIINMTRWSKYDLCGRLIDDEPDEWYIFKMRAVQNYDKEQMLCDDILDFESFLNKTRLMNDAIVAANYQQMPIELKGLLYKRLNTYDTLPAGVVKAYVDTADQGKDYLCCIVFVEHDQEAFLIDVMYTQESAEHTEAKLARMLEINGVNVALFESNSGGKSYARFVSTHLKTNFTTIKWFHQNENKESRILANAPWIIEHVYFPKQWANRWPEFFNHLRRFKKVLRANAFDDCADTLTGVAEMVCESPNLERADSMSGISNEVVVM